MDDLVYPHDRSLSALTLALGSAIWACAAYFAIKAAGLPALVGIGGVLALFAVIGALAYLFIRSAAVALLHGNGVEVTADQFPDIHAQFSSCCERLSLHKVPRLYIQNGNGVLNAFATWFLGRNYVAVLSSVVDAMEGNPSGVRFYLGHELGHVRRHDNPLAWFLRRPALCLPLVGAAFSRARESSCDLHGMACCGSREDAARSVVALAAGSKRWQSTSLQALQGQLESTTGFWTSFHELTASYPWTAKRAVRVLSERPEIPRRNPFAFLLAALVPYAGRMGSGVGFLLYVYFVGILASILIPAYQAKHGKTTLSAGMKASGPALDAITRYYMANHRPPQDLGEISIPAKPAPGISMSLGEGMSLSIETKQGTLEFTPTLIQGRLVWHCSGKDGMPRQQLPPGCE
mgnify:CR=1 FL=1